MKSPVFNWTSKHKMPPQKLVEVFVKAWPEVWKQIPREERVGFLKSVAEDHLGAFLVDMSREERASLMNGLFLIIAREFPLADLDILTTFSSPKDLYGEGWDEPEKYETPDD